MYNFSWIFNKWGVVEGGLLGIRVNSILSEPAQLAIILSPTVYLASRNLIHRDNYILNKYQSILILLVSLFTTSSIGLIGIVLSLLFKFMFYFGKSFYVYSHQNFVKNYFVFKNEK